MGNAEHVALIRKKSVDGIAVLLRRQVAVKIIFVAGNVLLARLLEPRVFGIYAIAAFALQFFSSFSDVGLGAALIQRKEEPSQDELCTTFWLQIALVGGAVLLVFLLAPALGLIYPDLTREGFWVTRIMALGFVFASLKTLPKILMERHLDFRSIARIDIAEQVVFYAGAVALALAGFGIWSFVAATILSEAVGAVLAYAASDWRPSRRFLASSIRPLVRFGLPYQGNNLMNLLKEGVTPVLIGAYSGAAAVGYLTWARGFAFLPLMLSESFGRVAFPAFSAIQGDRGLLKSSVEKSVRIMTLVLFPVTAILAASAPGITAVFFGEKWLPGLPAFYFFCTSPLLIGIMLPMYSAILSLGKSGILLKMTMLLVLLEWGFGILFVREFGFAGIAMNQPVITVIFFCIYRRVLGQEGVCLELLDNVWRQFICAAGAGIVVMGVSMLFATGFATILLSALAGVVVFVALANLMARKHMKELMAYATLMVTRGALS